MGVDALCICPCETFVFIVSVERYKVLFNQIYTHFVLEEDLNAKKKSKHYNLILNPKN